MNKADFRHNHFNKIQQLILERDRINKKIDAEIAQISFIILSELPDVPKDSILSMAERCVTNL